MLAVAAVGAIGSDVIASFIRCQAEPLNEAARGASPRHCAPSSGCAASAAPRRSDRRARPSHLDLRSSGAWIAGDALRRFQLPRLTGYLLFGVLAGPYLGNLINELMASQLQVITGIATTLIALIAGLSLNFERLGRRLTSIAYMTVVTIAVVAIARTRRVRMDRVAVAWTGAARPPACSGWR